MPRPEHWTRANDCPLFKMTRNMNSWLRTADCVLTAYCLTVLLPTASCPSSSSPLFRPVRIGLRLKLPLILIPFQQVIVRTEIEKQVKFAINDFIRHRAYLFAPAIFSHRIGAPTAVSGLIPGR